MVQRDGRGVEPPSRPLFHANVSGDRPPDGFTCSSRLQHPLRALVPASRVPVVVCAAGGRREHVHHRLTDPLTRATERCSSAILAAFFPLKASICGRIAPLLSRNLGTSGSALPTLASDPLAYLTRSVSPIPNFAREVNPPGARRRGVSEAGLLENAPEIVAPVCAVRTCFGRRMPAAIAQMTKPTPGATDQEAPPAMVARDHTQLRRAWRRTSAHRTEPQSLRARQTVTDGERGRTTTGGLKTTIASPLSCSAHNIAQHEGIMFAARSPAFRRWSPCARCSSPELTSICGRLCLGARRICACSFSRTSSVFGRVSFFSGTRPRTGPPTNERLCGALYRRPRKGCSHHCDGVTLIDWDSRLRRYPLRRTKRR